jgi:hypothetical protein
MPYKMNEQQLEAVLALSDHDRYKHFVSKVADWQELGGVRSEEGWLTPSPSEGITYFPFWPHKEYAQKVVDEHWPGHIAEELDYGFLISEGLSGLAKDSIKVAVFPNMSWQCVLTDARQLLEDLKAEAAQYEQTR